MPLKSLINEKLILAAVIFSPAYFMALQMTEKYNIDIGHLGQGIVELVTIPAVIMPVFIFGYAIAYMVATRKPSICLILSVIGSGLMMGGYIWGLFTAVAV